MIVHFSWLNYCQSHNSSHQRRIPEVSKCNIYLWFGKHIFSPNKTNVKWRIDCISAFPHWHWRVQETKWDLDATVYNLLLSTVQKLQNVGGALLFFPFFFLCLSEKAKSESRSCWWPFHTCLTAADPIWRGNLLRCTFGWRACTCQTDAWLTETLACTLSSDEHARTRGWLCSGGRLTDKTTIVAFLAPFCCTTEFIVRVFCSVFNVLTMHLKMKPKGNYWRDNQPFVQQAQ